MTEFTFEEVNQSAEQALNELNLPEKTQSLCMGILNDRRTRDIMTERNAEGIIAGAIYIAAILTENRLTQQALADVLDISEASIRKYYEMLVKILGIVRK